MNKVFNRTKDSGYLIQDANLDVTTALYTPNVSSEDDLNVGENDPDKPGAIATLTEGGITSVWVYQGDDVWIAVGASPPFELIAFTASDTGEQTIDFTTGGRASLFPHANVRAFNVDGDIETEITGFMKQFTRVGGLITEFYTDGVMGDGYFLLTN